MSTEKSDIKEMNNKAGWIFYDAECSSCTRHARFFETIFMRRGFLMAPLQESWVRKRLGLSEDDLLSQFWILTPDDNRLGGPDALAYLFDKIWWAWPIASLAKFTFFKEWLTDFYIWFAKHRRCEKGFCFARRFPHKTTGTKIYAWLPFLLLLLGVPFVRDSLPAWGFMWLYAYSIFIGLKWLTLCRATQSGTCTTLRRMLGYLFVWPGMGASEFLDVARRGIKPKGADWSRAFFNTFFGAFLFWGVARILSHQQPLLIGWTGLLGTILMLHFGTFCLITLLWQSQEVKAQQIMQSPVAATSLSDFWSNRWNLGFRQLSHELIFVPLVKRVGLQTAIFSSFIISGFIHELVISLPAQGGYGLPTAYFTLQGIGILMERSRFGKKLGLRNGWRGRAYSAFFTIAPLFWLFHPLFIMRVILPFMHFLGAV